MNTSRASGNSHKKLPSARSLSPDQLGEKGQSEFALLCANAGLICNPSTRDRAGWDYIVEFPLDKPSMTIPMDRRPQPPQCRAQIKALWNGGKHISLRLSSAERLAKLHCPACIFVFSINDDQSVGSLHGIHIIDNVLAAILKKVRACQAADGTKLNKTYIRLDVYRYGEKIQNNGSALRHFIESINGLTPSAYTAKKTDQIENLGFGRVRFRGCFTVEVKSQADLQDFMLGMKPVRVTEFSLHESRFNISLPALADKKVVELKFTPRQLHGYAVFRNRKVGLIERMKVDIHVPALPPTDKRNIMFRLTSRLFDVILSTAGKSSFRRLGVNADEILAIKEHIILNNVRRILAAEGGELELSRGSSPSVRFRINADFGIAGVQRIERDKSLLDVVKLLLDVVRESCDNIEMSLAELHGQSGALSFIGEVHEKPRTSGLAPLKLAITPDFPIGLTSAEALVFVRILFSNYQLATCMGGDGAFTEEDASVALCIGSLYLRAAEMIDAGDEPFKEFCEQLTVETGIDLSVIASTPYDIAESDT